MVRLSSEGSRARPMLTIVCVMLRSNTSIACFGAFVVCLFLMYSLTPVRRCRNITIWSE